MSTCILIFHVSVWYFRFEIAPKANHHISVEKNMHTLPSMVYCFVLFTTISQASAHFKVICCVCTACGRWFTLGANTFHWHRALHRKPFEKRLVRHTKVCDVNYKRKTKESSSKKKKSSNDHISFARSTESKHYLGFFVRRGWAKANKYIKCRDRNKTYTEEKQRMAKKRKEKVIKQRQTPTANEFANDRDEERKRKKNGNNKTS